MNKPACLTPKEIDDTKRESHKYYFDYRAFKKLHEPKLATVFVLWAKNHGHEVVFNTEERGWHTVQTDKSNWICYDDNPARDIFIVKEQPKPLTKKEIAEVNSALW